ncbi:MAG TPA: S-layer homology domain-containing protein [Candidatus Acutalibacter stercoravium]|nr:S-layer homology domain-containing protein [Candidatus Acutalibacter stercoravium]
MKKMWKRFVSLLLACTLLAGMLPLSASAAEKPGKTDWISGIITDLEEQGYKDTMAPGTAPMQVGSSDVFMYMYQKGSWVTDGGGNQSYVNDLIVIFQPGNGDGNHSIPDYTQQNPPEWSESKPSAVYFADGVTGIGNYAFASQPSLNNVVFQDASDLTYIGQRAFYDDDNAVFTDEGNANASSTIDLSNVEKMGEYAFYNCDKLTGVELGGNITAVEGNGNTSNKIPNHAFTSTGVKSITVPSGIEEVGEYAFYDCPLNIDPYISLQEGLKTIGNYAFGKNDAAPNTTMIGLTIPSSVESIGDHAFYNYTGLQTVTVLGKDNGGAKESALKHVGDAAFGDADHNAYSTTTTIQDAVNPEIEYTGLVGTQFYLPKELEKNDNLFVNGETCYTGNISPLTFELTVPATCTTDGYNQYYQTAQNTSVGGEALTLHVRVKIPALGHDWDKKNPVKVDATCTNNAYTYEVCKNDKTHHRTTGVVQNSALGHNYEVTDVDQPAINADNKTATIVTYTCKNYSVVPEKNKHDGQEPAQYQWTIPATTLEATTTDSLADIASQLPKPQGSHAASLEWAEEDTFADLQEGEKSYHVRLKVNHATFADYSDNNFTIQVKVSKAKLDFSDVRFVNADRWIGVANEEFAVEGLPEGVNQETLIIEYKLKSASDEAWSETKPSDDQEAKYEVRVTFTYDNTKYQLVTDEKELLPPSEYKLGKGTEENTGTIIGDYTIAQLNMDNIVVETPSLTFNGTFQNPKGTPQNTIRLNGVPEQSKVTFSWGDSGEQVIDDTGTNPLVSGAAITDAGTYTIRVKVEKDKYQDFERDVEVTIAPQTLTTPTATTSPTYDPGKIQTGVPYDNDGRYTMEDNTGTDAGDYAAKATVYNKNNYVWSAGDTDKDGTVEIPWRILYKLLPKPTIQTGLETATYDGTAQTPVSVTSSDLVVSYAGDVLQAKYKDELAYTATNARETDANDYTVTVQLKNKNYKWSDQTDGNITLSWKIEPKQIKAPTVTVANKVYDGKPYNTDGAEITNLVHSDDSEGILELGADHTYYEGHAKLESAPTNAGNYAVEVDFDFVEGQKATNYQIVQNNRQSFTITPAKATMEFTKKEVTEIYTAEGTALQLVEVSGLVGQDTGKEETVKKEVQYSYKYSETKVEDWSTVANSTSIKNPESQKFKEVGYYQITAKWGAGTVSNNYTATDATYTLTITQANDQKITLTSAKTNAGKWDEENNSYTTTYGSENTFTVTGKAALDNASISYAVKDGSEKGHDGKTADVVSVDSTGEVTIKQAGEATITVTAAETANVGAASVEYTVTVKKAKPTVNTGLEGDELTVAYTGKAITGYNKATAAANVVEGAAKPTGDITYTFYADQECKNKVTNGGGEDNNVPIAVGTYYMKASYPGDKNYLPAESKVVTVIVTEAQLTVDAKGYTGTYDGETHSAITVKSVTGNDIQLTEGNYTVKYAKTTEEEAPAATAENVWKDALSVKDVADSSSDKLYYWYMVTADNYNPAIGKVEVKITPAPLTVTGEPASYEKEYDGDKEVDEALTDITVTAEDVPDVTISVAATGTYADKDAGTKKDVTLTLTLSGTDGTEIDWGNYSYNDQALTEGKITLTKAGAGTITPKAITVTGISAVNRVYDGTTKVQLTGTPETTEGSFIGKDDVSFSAISNQTGTVTDAKAEDGKTVTVAAETLKGLLTGEDAENYTVTQEYPTTVDITPRPVTLQFPNGNSSMTTSYDPNGLTSKPNVYKVSAVAPAEGTGFVSSDALADGDIQYTFKQDNKDVENPINVGEYTVTAELTDEAAKKWSNYTIEAITGTVEIIQATEELTVTVTEKTGLTYTGQGQDPIQSISVKGGNVTLSEDDGDYEVQFKLSEEGDYELDRDQLTAAVKDAKEYTVYWQVTTTNYGNKTDSFTVKVAPATLTLSSSLTKEKKYDGATEAVVTGQKVTGAQNNESITVSSVSAAYDDANVDTDKTITTTYTVTFGADVTPGNYTYTGNVEGKATSTWTIKTTVEDGKITQAPITVAINDQKKVYDGQSLSIENPVQDTHWSTTGTIYLQDGVKDDLGITLSIASGSKDAGTYAITGAASNQNYEVTFTGSWTGEDDKGKAGTYTISPRPINVQIGDAEGFYGDVPDLTLETKVILTPETAQGENAGLVEGENIYDALEDLSLSSDATVSSPVREDYTIYPLNNGVVDQDKKGVYGNYDVTFTKEGTYTVKPRPITITISDAESDYGCDLAQLTYSKTLSEAYTGTNKGVVFVGDDETDLKIALFTTAKKGSDAGTYPISGEAKAESSVVSNYAITWKGQTPYQENEEQATYTVKKATLAVEFTNEEVTVSMGGTVNNPLKFINQSNSDEELGGQPQDVTVKYSSNDQGVATVNETTGEITLVGTGNATITAEVTSGGKNFTEGAKDSYIIHVAEDGGLLVTVTPKTLTYTGEMQNLISYSTAPAGAEVTFKVEAQTEGDRCQIASDDGLPQGQDAGTYRVSWVAKLQGYRDATGSTTVTIAKASPTTGFSKETVSVPYEENGTFDSTEETTLNVADDYNGTITYMSNDTRVASVQGNSLENISLNGTGSATITAVFTETDNYTAATASFRITVGTAETTISYTAEDYSVEYDRTAHGSKITVNSPSEYTIMYSDNNGTSYDLNESPTITDAGDLTIYFQIQADGYNSASGTQKVTVEPKEITANMIAGIAESYTYTGKEITFDDAISVHDEGVLLEKDKDYTITYDDNKEVGKGSVTITGTGNYKESVTKNFEITPVDASDLTASLDRTFGYYRNSETNNATVTVMHGSHTVDSSEITLTVTRQDSTIESGDVVQEGLKLTFNKAGIYTIHVVVAGTHTGTFDLTYTLLPQDVASDDFQVTTNPVGRVWTYDGENRAFGVTVTSGGTSLQKDVDFTLRYTYLPYVGSQEENEYDPESTEFTEAGIYTVIVEGTGNYTGHAELVALIQPRDLSDAGVTATFAQTELVYNGEAQESGVTLTYNGTAITQLKDTEYYGNTNAGEAQALSAAREDCNNFTGARVDAFTIEKKSLKDSTITAKADPEEYYYTGYPVTPAVTVTDSDRNVDLSIGADYTVSSDAVGPGKVTATVTGTGNYKDTVTVEFTILPTGAEPVETLNLTVTPSEWTWDNGQTKAAISVTFNGKELNDTDYQLTVSKDGETPQTVTKERAVELLSAPGEYTITATGVGDYKGSTDTETVTIKKIQPTVTVTATPNSLSGGGKVTLTLKGEKLPAFAKGEDLSDLLTVKVQNGQQAPDLTELEWTENPDGSLTAELTLPNTNETYTFALRFAGDEYYEPASSDAMVVVGQQTSGGGGGSDPGDQPADPDDTGVSDWLNTKDHLAYLAGYPGGTFGPDQNMTRAEAAQMFYNLLLEKDVEITVEFEDVPADAWYAKPVNTLASLGILSGVGNGRFDPERSITRAEFTVIAMKFANTSGGGVNIFSDVNEDDWFYSAVVDSTQYGWINGYPDGTFRPEATISRAEVTVIVNHMLGRAADRPYVIAHEEELNTFGDVNRGHWGYFHVAEATNAHEYHTEDGTESWTGLS